MGRPKGSKNKERGGEPSTPQVDATKPQGRGRGRPKLIKNSEVTPAGIRHFELKTKHSYTELAKAALSNTDMYDLYGIVIDASTAH
jgi:hypothetical protein